LCTVCQRLRLTEKGGLVTHEHEMRKAKLEVLLARLQAGKHVQNRDLEIWLMPEEYAGYLDEVAAQKDFRASLKQKPDTVKEYERLVKTATFTYNKGEGASQRGRSIQAKKHFERADTLFEDALTHLNEIMHSDPSLAAWFDRNTSWEPGSQISLSPDGVPRVVTSRSLDNGGGGLMTAVEKRAAVKIAAVKRALANIQDSIAKGSSDGGALEVDASSQTELQRRLAALKRK
jgi:hypothetical protein